jgi:hypothetical protein
MGSSSVLPIPSYQHLLPENVPNSPQSHSQQHAPESTQPHHFCPFCARSWHTMNAVTCCVAFSEFRGISGRDGIDRGHSRADTRQYGHCVITHERDCKRAKAPHPPSDLTPDIENQVRNFRTCLLHMRTCTCSDETGS